MTTGTRQVEITNALPCSSVVHHLCPNFSWVGKQIPTLRKHRWQNQISYPTPPPFVSIKMSILRELQKSVKKRQNCFSCLYLHLATCQKRYMNIQYLQKKTFFFLKKKELSNRRQPFEPVSPRPAKYILRLFQ